MCVFLRANIPYFLFHKLFRIIFNKRYFFSSFKFENINEALFSGKKIFCSLDLLLATTHSLQELQKFSCYEMLDFDLSISLSLQMMR